MDYNRQDLTGQDLTGEILTGDIEGSCFHQEQPNTVCFHADSTATFKNCNLTNCVVPVGCAVIGGCNDHLVQKNDLEYWKVDPDTLDPVEPINKKLFLTLGLSIDPLDIPAEKLDKPITDVEVV